MVNVTTSPNVTSGLDGSMRKGGPASAGPPEDEEEVPPVLPVEVLPTRALEALEALEVPEAGLLLPDALELGPPEDVPTLDVLEAEEPPPLDAVNDDAVPLEVPPLLDEDEDVLELEPPVHALNASSKALAFKTAWTLGMGRS